MSDKLTQLIARRKAMKMLNMKDTLNVLRDIGDLDQPDTAWGGFHDTTILAARSALHHIGRLRKIARKERRA